MDERDSKLAALQFEEQNTEKDRQIRDLQKLIHEKETVLKAHGLEHVSKALSHKEDNKSQPKSLRTWKAQCGQKKKPQKHEKAVSNQIPLMYKMQRIGSLPSKLVKGHNRFAESLALKFSNPRNSAKQEVEKKPLNSSNIKKSKDNLKTKKTCTKNREPYAQAKGKEDSTPQRKDIDRVFTIEFFQRSHSAPNRTSSKLANGQTYYIGQGQAKEAKAKESSKQDECLDLSFISASSNSASLDFNQNDLTLQKKLNAQEEEVSKDYIRKLTYSKYEAKKADFETQYKCLFNDEEDKENLAINARLFNSPGIFEVSDILSKPDFLHSSGQERKSIKILDQFQISTSKIMGEFLQDESYKPVTKPSQGNVSKQVVHRRNSTQFNMVSETSKRLDEVYSRIERNIRSSYSSGKRIKEALEVIQNRHTHNMSAEDQVLLGSLKKKQNPFLKPSPIGQKCANPRYKDVSRENNTEES